MGLSEYKRRIRRKLVSSSVNKDLISSLPDEVISRILSFLPTKYAVSTSVLSSRWKELFKFATTLDFDDSIYFYPQDDLGNGRRVDNSSFKEFVNEMLSQFKKSHITKFRLKCGKRIEYCLLYEWINAAFSHKIVEFELSIDLPIPCVLQLSQLTCENLVVLKLDCKFILRVPRSVAFPNIKVLNFKEVLFHGNSSIRFTAYCKPSSDYHCLNGILSGCPLLEELVIDGCDWNGGDLYIRNPKLRTLTLTDGMSGPIDQLNGSMVHIDLPSLVWFKYSLCLAEGYDIKNLNCVSVAHLVISFNDEEFEDEQDICNAILDLITGVCSCQFLHLSSQCLEALTSGCFELPVFRNLIQLDLALGQGVSWNEVLLEFLYCSPCLESLTLVQGVSRRDPDLVDGKFLFKGQTVPYCVKSRLKFINIEKFRGYKGEIRMVKYFLENARVLEEMEIVWDRRISKGDLVETEEEILELQKPSTSCLVAFK